MADASSYQRLDALPVKITVDRVRARIVARFPDRNLGRVAGDLSAAVDELLIHPRTRWYGVLRVASRTAMVLLVVVLSIGLGMVFARGNGGEPSSIWTWIQVVESSINDVVFAGVAIYFLWRLPDTVQRAHDLRALHRLRSLAHVIDMHQLTKDPDRFRTDFRPTDKTVELGMSATELGNYLDYCSELLSLVSKTAALFAESTTDETVLSTVEGIEALTTGMARKIWQKIAVLPVLGAERVAAAPDPSL